MDGETVGVCRYCPETDREEDVRHARKYRTMFPISLLHHRALLLFSLEATTNDGRVQWGYLKTSSRVGALS